MSNKPIPKNKKLYKQVQDEAKKKFDVWPSIYASSWVVREYKKRGGTYSGKKDDSEGIDRWYREKWIDVCQLPKIVHCGRNSIPRSKSKNKSTYPLCRPMYRITKDTPKTVDEMSKSELRRRCNEKKKNPDKKVQ